MFATPFRPAFDFLCRKTGREPQQFRWFVRVLDKRNVEKPVLSKFAAGFRHAFDLLGITASIIQGSAIGPASFVVGAADLKAVTPGNLSNMQTIYVYRHSMQQLTTAVGWPSSKTFAQWALDNNLKIHPAKFVEIVFVDNRKQKKTHPPPPLTGIARVTIKIFGVIFTNSLSVAEHVHAVISSSAQRGVGCGEGVSPSPLRDGSGEGAVPPPQKFF